MSKKSSYKKMKYHFWALRKGLNKIITCDKNAEKCVSILPQNFTILIKVRSSSQSSCAIFDGKNFYTYKKQNEPKNVDLEITIKSYVFLQNLLNCKEGILDLFNNNEIVCKGDLEYATAILYLIDIFLSYIMSEKRYQRSQSHKPNLAVSRSSVIMAIIFGKRCVI